MCSNRGPRAARSAAAEHGVGPEEGGLRMSLTKCKDCGASVSTAAKTCPQCGAPMKPRGIISSLARLFVIVFLVIPIGIGLFSAVYNSETSKSDSKQAPAKQPMGLAACSPADIEIKSLKVNFVDECRASPCIYMKGVAVLNNRCSIPVGVQIKITAYDKSGSPMATRDLWPASTNNIPPGDYTYSIDQWLDHEPGMASVDLTPISVKQWRN